MARAGQVIEGAGGLRLRLVRTGAETAGEVLEMEASYSGAGGMPPEHVHPCQRERFTVLEGAMRTVIGGEERRFEIGETFEVPAGIPHRMAADGPSRVTWEVRPALRTAEFFERLHAALAGGGEDLVQVLEDFPDEIRFT
jgi:quercetin dioxygenase-like cupin family protein